MKKTFLYLAILSVFIAAVVFIFYKYKSGVAKEENTIYTLLERKDTTRQTEEWRKTEAQAMRFLNAIRTNQQDSTALLGLATIFVQEARITGNYAYYDMAALKYTNDVLKMDSLNFPALTLKSLLYLSQHHFADGLVIAEKAKNVNPYNAYVYGLLVDGNVEMGNYDSAVANAQRMVDIRPDIRSYSRISYLREIYGDYKGAIDAMALAVGAGVPGDEATEWSRIQLGHLFENTGDVKSAEQQYTDALAERPGYAYALAGLARIATLNKDYNKAVSYYTQAIAAVSDFSFKEGLADVYRLNNEKQKADALENEVIKEMSEQAQNGNNNENIGHYVDRELAYAFIKTNDYDKALEHAMLEYNRRPANIDVNEALAWAYYAKGDYANALPFIKTALKTGSKNPTLLCRAGLIFAKNGDTNSAKINLEAALKTNANIPENLRAESKGILQAL